VNRPILPRNGPTAPWRAWPHGVFSLCGNEKGLARPAPDKRRVMIFFTELQHTDAYDVNGEYLGRLQDLCVDPAHNSLLVSSYLVRTPDKRVVCVTHDQMQSISIRQIQAAVPRDQIRCYSPDEGLLHVKKEVLDQQIIDVNHRKVVRVNDVDFDIQPRNGHTELRVLAVNVGLAAAIRRLLQGLMAKHSLRSFSEMFPSSAIPWEFVNLIESDPSRRVKLRISYDRLAMLHPADIADILEELSHDEQRAVIESLDEETAAQALSEIPTHMQAALLESFTREKAADIVEEMAPDEAADVLQEMPPETSAEVLADMGKEEATEVRELLGFEEKTAGALMTTDYIVVGEEATVEGAIAALRSYEGAVESVHSIFLVGPQGTLTGAVPIGRILLAKSDTLLKDLASEQLISVDSQADQKRVVDLFHKYNLLNLPVVDDKSNLLGVVTVDDVLEIVISHE
jgi:magnesium transporter